MNLFVSGLSRNITEHELKKMFMEFGTVTKLKLVMDVNTGTSRGFAFVEMASEDEAITAITQLNKAVVKGKSLSVQAARPKEDHPKKERPRLRRS